MYGRKLFSKIKLLRFPLSISYFRYQPTFNFPFFYLYQLFKAVNSIPRFSETSNVETSTNRPLIICYAKLLRNLLNNFGEK
jgi:hypothetical protein